MSGENLSPFQRTPFPAIAVLFSFFFFAAFLFHSWIFFHPCCIFGAFAFVFFFAYVLEFASFMSLQDVWSSVAHLVVCTLWPQYRFSIIFNGFKIILNLSRLPCFLFMVLLVYSIALRKIVLENSWIYTNIKSPQMSSIIDKDFGRQSVTLDFIYQGISEN